MLFNRSSGLSNLGESSNNPNPLLEQYSPLDELRFSLIPSPEKPFSQITQRSDCHLEGSDEFMKNMVYSKPRPDASRNASQISAGASLLSSFILMQG